MNNAYKMIEVKGLSIDYYNEKYVLKDISFEVLKNKK